jgi:hypothetical protein
VPPDGHTEPLSAAEVAGAASLTRSGAERRARTTMVAILATAQNGTSGVLAFGKRARRRAARVTPRTGDRGRPPNVCRTLLALELPFPRVNELSTHSYLSGAESARTLLASFAAVEDSPPCKNEPAQDRHAGEDCRIRMTKQQGGPNGTSEGSEIRHHVVHGGDEPLVHDMATAMMTPHANVTVNRRLTTVRSLPKIRSSNQLPLHERSCAGCGRSVVRGAATGASTGGRLRRPMGLRNRARQPVLKVPPAEPGRAPNDVPEERP